MRSQDKRRLGVVRLALAAIKQIEVDERIELDNERVIIIIDKMVKQRRESASQFEKGGRDDLADQEKYEIGVLQQYLPEQLSDDEIAELVGAAIQESEATSLKEMGNVMGLLKPKLQGRADMRQVSQAIKDQLG